MRVNCIFQGGGANFATLLCAVEALGQLEDDGFLELAGVAGTSAGSLAAACLAHPTPNPELIQKIINVATKNLDHFKIPRSRAGIIFKILQGSSLIQERRLESVIREFFKIDQKSFTFEDTLIPLYVCAADIKRSKRTVFKKGSEKPLEEALSNSCAIPFVFRGFSDGTAISDGGVMANLLDQSVFEESDPYALAFSFQQPEVQEYNGVLSFAGTVVGSMINNSVNETKVRVLQSGGYVCELPSYFGTLDFAGALEKLNDPVFRQDVVAKCKQLISDGLSDFHNRSALLAYGDRLKHLQYLSASAFNAIKQREPYRVTKGAIFCEAYSLFGKSDIRSRNPDRQIKRITIEPSGEGLQLFRIGIAKGNDFRLTNEISCRVFDANNTRVDATFEVTSNLERAIDERDVDKPNNQELVHPVEEAVADLEKCEMVHRLSIILKDWHSAEKGPLTVTLTTTHQQSLMEGLGRPRGNDWMRAQAHRDDEIRQQDFILLIPSGYRDLHLSDLRSNVKRCQEPPRHLSENDANWVEGGPLTSDQLDEAISWLQVGPEFRYVGWRTCNLTGRSSTGVLIEQDIGG
ncbi:MAG: patatin-like phospholipase family protein [Paracoccaceae bacterium]|uniref:patatin-like phospholipase family protein n=1 Tax=Pseudophaeobacter sp. TaxID=1971739 RepID=UPI0032862310